MRICYLSHSSAHFTAPYVDWFAGQGHEVHLVSLHRQDLPNAVNHHPWKRKFDPSRASWAYLLAVPAVRSSIRRIAPDILHAHYVTSNGMMAAASGVKPLVITAHGSDINLSLRDPLRKRAMLFALKRADMVNPVSSDLEQKIIELGIARDKMLRATLGVDTSRFVAGQLSRRPGPARIICTRHLLPLYGCDLIVKAAKLLADRGLSFELLFAGRGAMQAELEHDVERMGLDARVTFRGGYQPDELPALLADSDIYVSASKSDGTSISLLEAMAAGVFPVLSDIAANRDWVDGTSDGLLFGVDSAEELASCLELAIRDESLRTTAVDSNRERVRVEGDRDRNMAKLAEYYDRLVHRYKVMGNVRGAMVGKDSAS